MKITELEDWESIEKLWDYSKNILSPEELTTGMHQEVFLQCFNGHEFKRKAFELKEKKYSCRECSSIIFTHPEIAQYLDEEKTGVELKNISSGFGNAWWFCERGHSYQAAVFNKIKRKNSCYVCSGVSVVAGVNDLSTKYPVLIEFYSKKNKKTIEEVYFGRVAPLWWEFSCGHSMKSSPLTILKHLNCPYCQNRSFKRGVNDLRTWDESGDIVRQWSSKNSVSLDEVFYKSQESYLWVCSECSCEYRAPVVSKTVLGSSCSVCLGNFIVEHVNGVSVEFPELKKFFDEDKNSFSFGVVSKSRPVYWLCENGHSIFGPAKYLAKGLIRCSICSPRSKQQLEVYSFVKSICSFEVFSDDRTVISPYEVDIYVPELKKAIEYNGEYWHSDEFLLSRVGKTSVEFDEYKRQLCEEKKVEIIFIREKDWCVDKERVKEFIREFLG